MNMSGLPFGREELKSFMHSPYQVTDLSMSFFLRNRRPDSFTTGMHSWSCAGMQGASSIPSYVDASIEVIMEEDVD